ncbi:hypothetical protein [Mediterraneibacter gnavus]|uniref:hypothetical protein n=1 Tax=Mediterraneibacter gnavus TaxID=33038 RepID=UPI0032B71746
MSGGSFSERSFICSEIEAVSGATKISQRMSWGVTSKALAILQTYSIETVEVLWSSIFVTLMANKIGGLQFGIYRNCQISSRVFHTAVAALPLTKANRSDFE